MNQLSGIADFRNRYYVMRHALSVPNQRGIIVSQLANGVLPEFGLAESGAEQAAESARVSRLTAKTLIISSPFSRSLQTAAAVKQVLSCPEVQTSDELRERNFGLYESSNISSYAKVWHQDESGADQSAKEVESVEDVLWRATGLILDLEARYDDTDILLVSHGDVLQILQCGFTGADPRMHRSLAHLEPAEIRRLV